MKLLSSFIYGLLISLLISCGGQMKLDTNEMLKLSGRDRLPTQADFPDDGAVVLYEKKRSTLYLDSEWDVNVQTDYHIAVLYLNDKAEDSWATNEIYLSDKMNLLDFSARTTKPNGEVIVLTKEDLHPTQLIDGAEKISHEQSVKFTFPGVESGAILEYAYSINNEGWFTGYIWFLQKNIPVLYTKYIMEVPMIFFQYKNNWTYSANEIEIGKPEISKNIVNEKSDKNRSRIFFWELTDIPALKYEAQSPPYYDKAQYVNFDIQYKDWNELTKGYWKRIKTKFDDSDNPATKKLAEDIVGDASDEKTKIEKIFAYTQKNYRYIAVNIGESGYIPNTCQKIITNQYGDCKDMTVMNVNLLRALGIEAYPALVTTKSRGYVMINLISFRMFNHMIAYVKTKDGETYWLDATGSNCPLGQVYSSIEGKQALVIYRDGKSGFRKIPESRFPDNKTIRHITMNLTKDGELSGHATLVYTGNQNLSMRSRFRDASKNDMKKYWKRFINANTPDISLSNLTYDDPKEIKNKFKVEFDFNKERFGSLTSSLFIFNPAIFEMDVDLDRFIDDERKYPIVYWAPYKVEDEVTINFDPEKYDIEGLTHPVSEKFPFASFRCNSNKTDIGEISFKRVYRLRKTRISPKSYQDFRSIEKAIAAANEENIVLKLK